MAAAETAVAHPSPAKRPPSRFWARVRYQSLNVYAGLALLYLMVPIAVIILFSFNEPSGKFNLTWERFSLFAWRNVFLPPGLKDAVTLSLQVALVSTLIATILGTMIALALARYNFAGRSGVNFIIFLPMATPEIVMGSSLLTLFLWAQVATGFTTIVIAHIMFSISFVVVTVKARLYGFDRRLEEAAMDLYANEFQTFRKVTLPMIAPGILAGALLVFALSIDDFIVTQFNSGVKQTFPIYIYGAQARGIPVQVNVVASMIFLAAVSLMTITVLAQMRRPKNA